MCVWGSGAQYRGTLTAPGKNSPYRDRSVEENLEMFRKMKAGDYEEGTHVLRAKVRWAPRRGCMRRQAVRVPPADRTSSGGVAGGSGAGLPPARVACGYRARVRWSAV
jgi:hypothetical protein